LAGSSAHADQPRQITLANTIANPVPVIGNVVISGTPSVNVANIPAVTVDTAIPLQIQSRDGALLFNVPFSIDTIPHQLIFADINIPVPSILESFNLRCQTVNGLDLVTLLTDNQLPDTVNATSYAGSIGGRPTYDFIPQAAGGYSVIPPTRVTIPVPATIVLTANEPGSNALGGYCTGNLLLRKLN
jgi:hypothetical protein